MNCPICNSIIRDDAISCNICKTEGLDSLFLSEEAKQYWINQNHKKWEKEIIAHGSCGTSSNWLLKKDGRLIISGSGNIADMKKGKEVVEDEYAYEVCFSSEYFYFTIDTDTVPWRDHRDKITCVDIAEGIIGIGENAFSDCGNLSSVHLPDTVKTIGEAAFKNCNRLIIKALPTNLAYIGDDAFLHSDGYSGCLVNYIPSTLNYIGSNAFYVREGNKNLRTVVFSKNLTHIGKNAFRGCSNMSLASEYLPDTLSWIGENAFGGCWDLRRVVLPDRVTSICDYAFADCHNLTDVKFSNELRCIGDSAFSGCKNIQKIEIPSTIEDIKNYAFKNCVGLQRIVFKGKFPEKNTRIYHEYARDGKYFTIGQYKDYLPFAGTGYVDVYYKASNERSWRAITLYNWGAQKIYWHRVR